MPGKPMTMAQKVLAEHCGREYVSPGEFVMARVDLVLANDITAPIAVREFRRMGAKRVFDSSRIALVPDHFIPQKDIKSAEQAKAMREFAAEQSIVNYFELGRAGIEHALLPEKGLVCPGDLVVGADSHTCTYGAIGAFATGVGSTDAAFAMAFGKTWFKVPESFKVTLTGKTRPYVTGKDVILHLIGKIGVDGATYKALEFSGPGLDGLSMDSRFAMANMAVEAGAKAGLFPVDEICLRYIAARPPGSRAAGWLASSAATADGSHMSADAGASYQQSMEIALEDVELLVALPHCPANVRPAKEVRGVAIDQCILGSCTNGRLEDLRIAAALLEGRSVHPTVRMIVIPGTQDIYLQALKEGLIEKFIRAGAAVSTPTCGPCLGGHMGVLAAGERAVSTTNRNFVGRMGHVDSEVYLCGPAVAAASAVLGRVATPEEVVG